MEITKDLLKGLYVDEGKSLREIGSLVGKTATGVSYLLKKFSIPRRTKSQARLIALQKGKFEMFDYHKFNRDFFKRWGPESIYLFGLAMADGSVSRGVLSFTFGKGSRNLAYNIAELMESEKGPKEIKNNGYPAWRIYFSSVEMIEDMQKMGMPVGARSLTKQFPVLPGGLESHFIRGYFDGNGSVSPSSKLIRIHTGSKDFLVGVQTCIKKCFIREFSVEPTGGRISTSSPSFTKLPQGTTVMRKPAYTLTYASIADRTHLYHWFYDDAPPYTWLERKRVKWAGMIGLE